MKRLFELREAGKLRTAILPYLGQDDRRLKFRPTDLVTREEAYGYPTDFSAMTEEWIQRLARRGEQLTKALIAEHTPEYLQTFQVTVPEALSLSPLHCASAAATNTLRWFKPYRSAGRAIEHSVEIA
jgi:hypothetical protein